MGWPGPMTHRQYLLWRVWSQEQWNRPSRSDHYLMAVARELRALPHLVWGEQPPESTLDDLRVSFTFKSKDGSAEDDETEAELFKEQVEFNKCIVLGILGIKR